MYHELGRAGRAPCENDPGYRRYVVDERQFAEHLAWIAARDERGVSVGEACAARLDTPQQVALTFDDGCETDLIVAAPLLAASGFGATFYVVSRWIGGRLGFMTAAQLKELAAAGFEVGSHSATHAFLATLDDARLRAELVESKQSLEDLIGRPVVHLSCPGGRWSRRVARAAVDAGYQTVATSRVGINDGATSLLDLARCAVLKDTSRWVLAAYCGGGAGLAALQLRHRALAVAKSLLGRERYSAVRAAALARTAEQVDNVEAR